MTYKFTYSGLADALAFWHNCLVLGRPVSCAEHFLIQQPGRKPERCIVQTDHTVYLKMCPGIVPRAAVMFFQKASAHIFGGENKQHI